MRKSIASRIARSRPQIYSWAASPHINQGEATGNNSGTHATPTFTLRNFCFTTKSERELFCDKQNTVKTNINKHIRQGVIPKMIRCLSTK